MSMAKFGSNQAAPNVRRNMHVRVWQMRVKTNSCQHLVSVSDTCLEPPHPGGNGGIGPPQKINWLMALEGGTVC